MDILSTFQKLLDNVAVKMKQLWVCGFSNFVDVSVTSLHIPYFCARHLPIWCACIFSCVNGQLLTFWFPVNQHIASFFLDKILNNAFAENSNQGGRTASRFSVILQNKLPFHIMLILDSLVA